ncbi:MAG: hypothetical protein NT113_02380 [Hyphomicrobiales bacterium]|nr:hypothetical protein [Hyphomicrobiales bacterium]
MKALAPQLTLASLIASCALNDVIRQCTPFHVEGSSHRSVDRCALRKKIHPYSRTTSLSTRQRLQKHLCRRRISHVVAREPVATIF